MCETEDTAAPHLVIFLSGRAINLVGSRQDGDGRRASLACFCSFLSWPGFCFAARRFGLFYFGGFFPNPSISGSFPKVNYWTIGSSCCLPVCTRFEIVWKFLTGCGEHTRTRIFSSRAWGRTDLGVCSGSKSTLSSRSRSN